MREHDRLLNGQPINEQAARKAQNDLMMSLMNPQQDPETGEVMGLDPQLLQASVEAPLQPLPFESYAAHLEVHAAYMKSPEFEELPIDVRERFYKHFEFTQQALQNSQSVEGQAPRVSLQLRGPIGPSTGSKILQQAGVKGVTPQEMLEPALDTVVIDNKDKPNAEDTQFDGLDKYQQDVITKMVGSEMMNNQKMQADLDKQAVDLVRR